MQHSKISITILSLLLFGNSLNCMSATQKRVLKRGKSNGTLVTPDSTIITDNPGQVPIVPPIEYDDDNNKDDNKDDTKNPNTSVSIPNTIADAEKIAQKNRIKEIRAEYRTYLNNAQLNCIGVSKTLGLIQGLAIGTTVVSGAGALASGGAMTSNLIKDNREKRDTLETGLLIGSAATSVGGIATSAISISNIDNLLSKMKSCKGDITNISNIKQRLLEEDVDETDATILQIDEISNSCNGINNDSIENIESVKGLLIGSTITSSIGAAGSIAATVTNAKSSSESDNDKKKNLNIATAVTSGVATGAQSISTILGGVTINKINKDKDTADKCEDTLMKY